MQKLTVDELKRLLYETFCDHLTMKDIENIIMTEESHLNSPSCQVDIDSKSFFKLTILKSEATKHDNNKHDTMTLAVCLHHIRGLRVSPRIRFIMKCLGIIMSIKIVCQLH